MRNEGRPSKPRIKPRFVTDDFGNQLQVRRCSKCNLYRHTETGFYQKHTYGVCKVCKREYHRQWVAQNYERELARKRQWYADIRSDPDIYKYYYERRKATRKPRDKEKLRAYSRTNYHRMKNDPERYQRYLENRRIYARLRREQAGAKSVPQRSPKKLKFKIKYPDTKVPMKPIAEWVDRKLSNGYQGSVTELAKACEVSERLIFKIREREEPVIRLMTVDKMLLAEGTTPLEYVYPDL